MYDDLDEDGKNNRDNPLKIFQIKIPPLTPLLFDGVPPSEAKAVWAGGWSDYFTPAEVGDYHNDGGHNVVFVDGHVKSSTRKKIPELEIRLKERLSQMQ